MTDTHTHTLQPTAEIWQPSRMEASQGNLGTELCNSSRGKGYDRLSNGENKNVAEVKNPTAFVNSSVV